MRSWRSRSKRSASASTRASTARCAVRARRASQSAVIGVLVAREAGRGGEHDAEERHELGGAEAGLPLDGAQAVGEELLGTRSSGARSGFHTVLPSCTKHVDATSKRTDRGAASSAPSISRSAASTWRAVSGCSQPYCRASTRARPSWFQMACSRCVISARSSGPSRSSASMVSLTRTTRWTGAAAPASVTAPARTEASSAATSRRSSCVACASDCGGAACTDDGTGGGRLVRRVGRDEARTSGRRLGGGAGAVPGCTSTTGMASIAPESMPAWIAAPSATAPSGSWWREVIRPRVRSTATRTPGTCASPPAKYTAASSVGDICACASAARAAASTRALVSSRIPSKRARPTQTAALRSPRRPTGRNGMTARTSAISPRSRFMVSQAWRSISWIAGWSGKSPQRAWRSSSTAARSPRSMSSPPPAESPAQPRRITRAGPVSTTETATPPAPTSAMATRRCPCSAAASERAMAVPSVMICADSSPARRAASASDRRCWPPAWCGTVRTAASGRAPAISAAASAMCARRAAATSSGSRAAPSTESGDHAPLTRRDAVRGVEGDGGHDGIVRGPAEEALDAAHGRLRVDRRLLDGGVADAHRALGVRHHRRQPRRAVAEQQKRGRPLPR